jgi:hypothetical protein
MHGPHLDVNRLPRESPQGLFVSPIACRASMLPELLKRALWPVLSEAVAFRDTAANAYTGMPPFLDEAGVAVSQERVAPGRIRPGRPRQGVSMISTRVPIP